MALMLSRSVTALASDLAAVARFAHFDVEGTLDYTV